MAKLNEHAVEVGQQADLVLRMSEFYISFKKPPVITLLTEVGHSLGLPQFLLSWRSQGHTWRSMD